MGLGLIKRFANVALGAMTAASLTYIASIHLEASTQQKVERWLAYQYLPDTQENRIARDINRSSFRDMGERGFLWGFGTATAGFIASVSLVQVGNDAVQKRQLARKLIAEAEAEELFKLTLEGLKEVKVNDDL